MNVSRLTVVLAVLAAFIAGIATGLFLGGSPKPLEPAKISDAMSDSSVAQSAQPEASESRLADELPIDSAVEALVSRLAGTLTIADENQRHREWLSLLPSLTASDAAELRELFRKLKAQGRRFDFEWATFWPRWGELDGAAAIEHVIANEATDIQPAAAEMILRGWAKTNTEGARTWLTSNSTSPLYGSALRGYVDGLARRDLTRATRDALVLGRGREMTEFVEVLAEQALQQRQLEGLLEWWRTLPDDPAQNSARIAATAPVLSRLMNLDAARAQAWLTDLAATTYRDEGSIGAFAERLAQSDPAAAVGWVASLPAATNGHHTGIGRTIRAWADKDKASVDRWIASLPASPLREQAIEAQQQQTFVIADFIHPNTQFNRPVRVSRDGARMQIKVLPSQEATLEISEGK